MAKAVIMAGGQGERFWPLTHEGFPKYRLKIEGSRSLLQNTYRRLLKVYRPADVHVVTTREHARHIREELPSLDRSRIFVEPFRNNTASAIYYSTVKIAKAHGEETAVSFFPADHLIQAAASFKKTMLQAIRLAEKKENLVTIGIKPTFPATSYGYILAGSALEDFRGASNVSRFTEKPKRSVAEAYVKRKGYFWNSGIFTWRCRVFLDAMRRHAPRFEKNFDVRNVSKSYKKLPKISIDYALFEKARNSTVVKTAMDWCDVGNWDMYLEKYLRGFKKDEHGNLVQGECCHEDSTGNLLLNLRHAPLLTHGISGLIVVQTERGTLICRRERSEEGALLFKRRKK